MLTVEASNLLRNKYPEIAYLEDVHNETQRGGVLARFECLSVVVCLDVSPQLDYMVCECEDGMLRLWSLQTGRLVWTRPVIVEKSFRRPGSLDMQESYLLYMFHCFVPLLFTLQRNVFYQGF